MTKKVRSRQIRGSNAKQGATAAKDPQAAPDQRAERLAQAALRPTVQAALTLAAVNKGLGDLPLGALVDDLIKRCDAASAGNLEQTEAILTAQAHTLDSIFQNLVRRAERANLMNQFETYMRLALKAQNQCRSTLATLVAIKNPASVAFVRQANIAAGPQQVNNVGSSGHSGSGRIENPPTKLLEQTYGERLDFGAAGTAGRADQNVGAVAKVDRAKDD